MVKWLRFVTVLWIGLSAPLLVAQQDPGEQVLIRTGKPYTQVVAAIEAQGGRVVHQFKYLDAISAEVPRAALPSIRALVGAAAVTKDEIIVAPRPVDVTSPKRGPAVIDAALDLPFESASVLGAPAIAGIATVTPTAYIVNNAIANISGLHAGGYTGSGVVVAVIDSGIRPGFPHIGLDNAVIGCEDFVGDALGCSHSSNSGHGTFVAGMITASVAFTFATTAAFRNAVLAECPACFTNAPTNTVIPMIGTAPQSDIYALRVLPAVGGTPTSRVIAAIERVIELRELYDAGDPAGQNIQVCNLSLGGPTLFAGRDLFDTVLDMLIDHDIVPVVAAGNTGPSSLTTASPGSALTAITVGAASLPHNERILRRAQFGPALGSLYRPFLGVQTAFFSSRGPHADGRLDPDVVANGFANYGQGFGTPPGGISIGSGTSFASPSVAGVAAVLRQRFPSATAKQIRNAIITAANPAVLTDGSGVLDRGAGYVDAAAAASLLEAGSVSDSVQAPPRFNSSVNVNIAKSTDLPITQGFVQQSVTGLRPGQRHDIVYRVLPNTRQVVVSLSGVAPALPPAQQNQLFGDDILFAIHSAKTSAILPEGDYNAFDFTLGGTYVVDDPEPGLMRVTLNGDWTNAGEISAVVSIASLASPLPGKSIDGKLANGQTLIFPLDIPAGVSVAEFRLGWREDWGRYPTNDIDLILVRPDNSLNFGGATLNNPEVVLVQDPAPGRWLMIVDGFEVASGEDKFDLRVTFDGQVVK